MDGETGARDLANNGVGFGSDSVVREQPCDRAAAGLSGTDKDERRRRAGAQAPAGEPSVRRHECLREMRSHGSLVQVLSLSSGVVLRQAVPGEALVAAQEGMQDA